MSLTDGITLLTSDSRPRYANDALAVLALPGGSTYHFRYDGRYLPAVVKHGVEQGMVSGVRALVCYREEANASGTDQILVPLRWVKILGVDRLGEMYVFRFSCAGYAHLAGGMIPQDRAALVQHAAAYRATYSATEWALPVHVGLTSLAEPEDTPTRDAWIGAARMLSYCKF